MEVSNSTVLLIVLVAVAFVLFFYRCGHGQRDGFTRSGLTACNRCQFVRTPVDFAMKQRFNDPLGDGGWQSNPHYMADPGDKDQPLGFGPVDLWADQRKLQDGTLFDQYGPNYVGGDGDDQGYIVNDTKTRSLLSETGDLTTRRMIDHIPANGQPLVDAMLQTEMAEMMESKTDPRGQYYPLYGGNKYLVRRELGS